MNENLQYSKTGQDLTEQFEGCRLVAYQDTRGVWTIGYGHTTGVHAGMTCTQAQAEQWLLEDIQYAVNAVKHYVTVALTQGEFDALVDFVFNVGVGNFAGSTLLRKLNAGDYAGAAHEFERWDMAGGKHIAGLLRRRIAEENEFTGDAA
ncbi:MAG: lysozyme [Burkholderia multivorans]|nr:lysozyme [Burkholderia multivorans]